MGIGEDDDLRKKLFEEMQKDGVCEDVDYGKDIEPWLGERAAIAAVHVDKAADPEPVLVLAVSDKDKAEGGIDTLRECGSSAGLSGESATDGDFVIEGDWMVFAEDKETAEKVVDMTAESSLDDDDDFQKWTDEMGDRGVMTMYAAPEAGRYIAEQFEGSVRWSAAPSAGARPRTTARPARARRCGRRRNSSRCART